MISFVLFLVEVLAIPFQKAQVELYHPPTTVSYTKKLQKRSLGTKKMTTAEDAINYLSKEFDIDSKAINITKQYTDQQGILHVYGDRLLNGIAVDNQNFGIHLKDGEILSVSSSFVKDAVLSQVSKRDTELKIEKIISIAEKQYDCPRSNYPVKKIYIQTSDSTIVSAYQFHLRDLDDSKWYQVTSDAKTGDIVQLVDYIHSASYNAVNVHKPNVQAGLEMIENPEYLPSSPLGWHNDGFNVSPFTRGNNCDSLFSVSSKRTFSTRPNVFESTFDSTGDPFLTQNLDAAIINTFYGILFFMVAINVYHDITYQFGFTEEAGNFQTNNFGKGGLENDAIIIRNNDPLKRNNAYFAAPEDGINGVLGLHVFDTAHPFRMASFDNTILAHEFFHGVTTRLTGGSQKSNCLNTREGRALEEGWSDFFCILMQTSPTSTRDTNYFAGSYAYNYLTGFRNFPFSVNMQKNPLKCMNYV
jgi:extracellular elastinolytic metalloproteinase